tara:strand:- start:12921 stop:14555 length:1635 start_codon:yes stop_codon:yes gene_type:complete
MKPLNLDNSPCNPISSNCVVWQGPDITCINLCNGDTVSDVVNKLATELCTIMETLKISNYDLTCFNLTTCGPADFQALIQLLINKICELEGVTPSEEKGASGCPDCVVSVAECFITGNQTTMQLTAYVNLIGERICSIISDIALINEQIADILVRITNLEDEPAPTFTMPRVSSTCPIGDLASETPHDIDTFLSELVNNTTNGYCSYISVLGLPADITTAVTSQCVVGADATRNNPGVTYSTLATWVGSPTTVEDAITNLWLVVCDLYSALGSSAISVVDTNTIDLNMTAGYELSAKIKDTGWVDLAGFEFYSGSATKPQVRRIGNVLHFRGYIFVPLSDGAGGIQALGSFADYNSIPRCNPATGVAGGVTISSGGVIQFNQGTSSIPSAVTGNNLDADYRMPYPAVLSRPIIVTGSYGTVLTAAARIGITNTGILYVGSLRDQEEISGAAGFIGGSHLRFITSNVRSGESIPNYINSATDIHNFPAAGANNLVGETDFSGTDYTWPFSCDAGDSSDLGGFFATIEGLTAFLACDADMGEASCY